MPSNLGFYNLNESRSYPLDDLATLRSDDGAILPSNLLVDASIHYPRTLGRHLAISGVAVTAGIVTVLIGASDSLDGSLTPVAAVSLPRPVEQGRMQQVEPLVNGVAGWLAFGSGAEVPFLGRFSTAQQGLLLHRCFTAYRPSPVTSFGKLYNSQVLSGMVQLLADPPLQITQETWTIDDNERDVIVFSLDRQRTPSQLYSDLAGPCGGRPLAQTCPGPAAIEVFNNRVFPDCNGQIKLYFHGFITAHGLLPSTEEAELFELDPDQPNGMAVSVSFTQDELCSSTDTAQALPDADGVFPAVTDLCSEDPDTSEDPGDDTMMFMTAGPLIYQELTAPLFFVPDDWDEVDGWTVVDTHILADNSDHRKFLPWLPSRGSLEGLTLSVTLTSFVAEAGLLLALQPHDDGRAMGIGVVVDGQHLSVVRYTDTTRFVLARAPLTVAAGACVGLKAKLRRAGSQLSVYGEAENLMTGQHQRVVRRTWPPGWEQEGMVGLAALGQAAFIEFKAEWSDG